MNREALLKKRKEALALMEAMLNNGTGAEGALSTSELETYNTHKATITSIDVSLDQLDEMERMNAAGVQHATNAAQPTRPALVAPPAVNGLSAGEENDIENFSMVKFIAGAVNRSRGDGAPLDGLELEMAQEARTEATAHGVSLKGIGVPQMVLAHQSRVNAMTVTGTNEGGDLVATELRSMIDILRDNTVLGSLGAQNIGGLSGNVEWPVIIDGAEPTEKSENGAADVRTLGTGIIKSTPKRLPVVSEYSSQLLLQSSSDVESFVRQDLMSALALRMDRQAIAGDGIGENVLGLLNTPGIGAVLAGGLPTEDTLIDLEGAVELLNALDGNLGYLTNTKVKTRLKKTRIEAGQTDKVWGRDGNLNGYSNVGVTNLVPSNLGTGADSAIVFGNWADMLLNQWGGLDVIVNPYSKDDQGLIRVTVSTFFDMVLRRAASFAAAKDVATTA